MSTTMNQDKALALIPKVSGPLSIFGSCWILYEIIKDRQKKFKKPYHRLLFSMCIVDVLSSTCLALSTWPIPSATSDRWGASGNDATCSAQAFFIQANISSPIFNFMLSLLFLLKIKYRYTDKRISKTIEPAMQTFTLVFGLGTSAYCLAMDLFADSSLWCWINATPKGCVQTFQLDDKDEEATTCVAGDNAGIYRWAFFFAPLWASAFGAMIIMAMLYRYVHQTEKTTQSYDFELSYFEKQIAKESQRKQQHYGSASFRSSISDSEFGSSVFGNGLASMGDILADVAGDDDNNNNNNDDLQRQLELLNSHDEDNLDDISVFSFVSTGSNKSTNSVRYLGRSISKRVNTAWTKRKQLKKIRSQKRRECRKSKIVARQAYRYVGVFYITWIAGTINRLLQLLNGGKSFYWLMVLHAIFTPLQGFFNWLVYMYPKWEKQRMSKHQERKRELREQQRQSLMQQQPDHPRLSTTAENSIGFRLSSNTLSSFSFVPPTESIRAITSHDRLSSMVSSSGELAPLEEKSSLNDKDQLIGGQIMCYSGDTSVDPNSSDGKSVGVAVDEDISSDEDSVSPQSPAAEMGDINDGRVFETGYA